MMGETRGSDLRTGVSPQEFYERCEAHDWYYPYSDDARVYRRGKEADDDLRATANSSPVLRGIYTAWSAYIARRGDKPQPPSASATARPESGS